MNRAESRLPCSSRSSGGPRRSRMPRRGQALPPARLPWRQSCRPARKTERPSARYDHELPRQPPSFSNRMVAILWQLFDCVNSWVQAAADVGPRSVTSLGQAGRPSGQSPSWALAWALHNDRGTPRLGVAMSAGAPSGRPAGEERVMADFDMSTVQQGARLRRSPYYEATQRYGPLGFTVYNHMLFPIRFDDLDAEYWHLLRHVTLWDVSVERNLEISGPDALRFAQLMTPRDLSACAVGQAKYVLIVASDGGILNDPVMLRLDEDRFWFSLASSDVLFYAKG